MAKPLALTDDQMSAVLRAAEPLDPDRRSDFLIAVAADLSRHAVIGDGDVYRTVATLQRRFFSPPDPRHAPNRRALAPQD